MNDQKYYQFFKKVEVFSEVELLDEIYNLTHGNNLNFLLALINEFNYYNFEKWGDYKILTQEEEFELEESRKGKDVVHLYPLVVSYFELNRDILNRFHWRVDFKPNFPSEIFFCLPLRVSINAVHSVFKGSASFIFGIVTSPSRSIS